MKNMKMINLLLLSTLTLGHFTAGAANVSLSACIKEEKRSMRDHMLQIGKSQEAYDQFVKESSFFEAYSVGTSGDANSKRLFLTAGKEFPVYAHAVVYNLAVLENATNLDEYHNQFFTAGGRGNYTFSKDAKDVVKDILTEIKERVKTVSSCQDFEVINQDFNILEQKLKSAGFVNINFKHSYYMTSVGPLPKPASFQYVGRGVEPVAFIRGYFVEKGYPAYDRNAIAFASRYNSTLSGCANQKYPELSSIMESVGLDAINSLEREINFKKPVRLSAEEIASVRAIIAAGLDSIDIPNIEKMSCAEINRTLAGRNGLEQLGILNGENNYDSVAKHFDQ